MLLQQGHAAQVSPLPPALTFHGACLTPAKNNPLLLDKIHQKPLLQTSFMLDQTAYNDNTGAFGSRVPQG